ncbi:MAG: MOSC domain-containing protein [Hyphomicrobiaceae bacterium]
MAQQAIANGPTEGRLVGIARRDQRRAPMEEIACGDITVDGGLAGDHKGPKFPKRRITIMTCEDWRDALDALAANAAPVDLPWTVRRANLLVQGVRLPRGSGGLVKVGPVVLEVTFPALPCRRMDEAYAGLRKALHPDWRGGVTCAVRQGGHIRINDRVEILSTPPEPDRRLPG